MAIKKELIFISLTFQKAAREIVIDGNLAQYFKGLGDVTGYP